MELERLLKQISFLEKAYISLKEVLDEQRMFSDLEKDGIIQRFEYNVELAHKTLKKILEYEKVNFLATPREIIRESFKLGFIDDLELWEDFLDIRNHTSHLYSANYAQECFTIIMKHYSKIGMLLEKLENFKKKEQ